MKDKEIANLEQRIIGMINKIRNTSDDKKLNDCQTKLREYSEQYKVLTGDYFKLDKLYTTK